jgi:hypothetical protein
MRQLLAAMLLSAGCIPKPLPVVSAPPIEPESDFAEEAPVVVINTTLDQEVLDQWNEDHSGYLQFYEQFPFSVVESGVALPSTLDGNARIQAYLQDGYHALFENNRGAVSLITYYFRQVSDIAALHEQIAQLKKVVTELSVYDRLVKSGVVPEDTLKKAYAQASSSLQETPYAIPSPPTEPLIFYLVPGKNHTFFQNISPSILLGRNTPTGTPSFITEISVASFDVELSSDPLPYVAIATYFDIPSSLVSSISSLTREGRFSEVRDKYRKQLEGNSYTELFDINRDGLHAMSEPEKYDELCVSYKTGEISTRSCHSFALTRERKDDLLAACSDASSPQCLKNKNLVASDLELQQRTVAWYNHTLSLLDTQIAQACHMFDSDAIASLAELHRLQDEIRVRKEAYGRLLLEKYAVNPSP